MKKIKQRILSFTLAAAMSAGLLVMPAAAASARVSIGGGGGSLSEGNSATLTANVREDISFAEYDWSSSNSSVLSVDGDGPDATVYAVSAGTATIYLDVDGLDPDTGEELSGSASTKITVTSSQREREDLEIEILGGNLYMDSGETTAIYAEAVSVDPGKVTYVWGSQDTSVATVSGRGNSCTITAVGPGTTTVYVNATRDGGGYGDEDGASISVTVSKASNPIHLSRNTSGSSYTLSSGQNMGLGATASGGSGRYRYEWTSSGSVSVSGSNSSSSTVYARYEGSGEAVLTAYDANDSGAAPASISWSFTVTGGKISASLSKTSMTLSPNDTDSLTMTVSGGKSPYTYYWKSDNERVATVSGSGSTVTIRAGSSNYGNNRAVISCCAVDATEALTSETLTCVVTLQGKNTSYNTSASATVGSTLGLSTIANSIASEYRRQFGTSLGLSASATFSSPSSTYGNIRLQDDTPAVSGRTYTFAAMQDMVYTASKAGTFSTSYTISENGNVISGTITISNSGSGRGITEVSMSKTRLTMDTYSDNSLRLYITPSNASYSVSWSSSNTNIATVRNADDISTTVSTKGREGQATITATVTDATGSTKRCTCVVTVENGSTYNPTLTWTLGSDYYGTTTSSSMAKQFKKIYGYSLDYSRATIRFSDTGNSRYGVMHRGNGRSISSNTSYTFDEFVDMYFEPVAAGTWDLPYTLSYNGDTLKGTITVTIKGSSVSVKMNPTSMELSTYSSQYIDLTVSPRNYRSISWTSSNTNIASVSGDGLRGTVTSKGMAGTATITATVTDSSGSRVSKNCTVKVTSGSSFNPSVATTYGVNYTGTGTSEAMASQYKNLYGTSINNNQATIRFAGVGDNNIAVLRLEDGTLAQANKDYTFAQYIKMHTDPKAAGNFIFPYTLTYNGKSLSGNVIVTIAPAPLHISLSSAGTSPKTLAEAQINGISATTYINNYLINALGHWSYVSVPEAANSNGTLYQDSARTPLNSATHISSSAIGNLYYVPNKAGTSVINFNVYNSSDNLLAYCSLTLSFGGQSASEKFTDVPASSYYAEAVTWAIKADVTSGTSETTFGPDSTVTRAQAVSFMWRSLGRPAPIGGSNHFTDVKNDAWYVNAVMWAVEQGIVYGTSETTFSPNDPVTREQMITFLARTEGIEATVDTVYQVAIEWARNRGMLSGIPGEFNQKEACPRRDVVYYIWQKQP